MITFVELRNTNYTWQTTIEKEMRIAVNKRLYKFRHYPDFVREEDYINTRYLNTGGWVQFLTPHLKDYEMDLIYFDGSSESIDQLQNKKSEIYLLSLMTLNYDLAKQFINRIDRKNSIVIIGGVHPTLNPEETFEDLKPDLLVVGEADHTIEEIIYSVLKNRMPTSPGVMYKEGKKGRIKKNNMDNILSDINSIKLDWTMHLRYTEGVNKFLPIIICSRDCPYSCNFCSIVKTKKYRLLPIEKVIAQIEELQKMVEYHPLHVMFEDPIFFGNIEYTKKLVTQLERLNITWDCQNRIEKIDDERKELYQQMKRAGCKAVYFGVESTKQKVIDNANKKFKVENIISCLKAVRDCGILVHIGLMVGMPNQNLEDVQDDLAFAINALKEDLVTTVEYFFLSIYPGSKYANSPEEFGLKLHNFKDYSSVEMKVRHSTKFFKHYEIWDLYLQGCKILTEAHKI